MVGCGSGSGSVGSGLLVLQSLHSSEDDGGEVGVLFRDVAGVSQRLSNWVLGLAPKIQPQVLSMLQLSASTLESTTSL